MKKKAFICVLSCALFIMLAQACQAADMYVQSLSMGDDNSTGANSSITYTTKEFPKQNKTKTNKDDEEDNIAPIVINNNNNPYFNDPYNYVPYNNGYYSSYRIGPYYSTGITIGGFSYRSYRSPRYIVTPPMFVGPPPPPPAGMHHRPHRPPQHFTPPHHGRPPMGHHGQRRR